MVDIVPGQELVPDVLVQQNIVIADIEQQRASLTDKTRVGLGLIAMPAYVFSIVEVAHSTGLSRIVYISTAVASVVGMFQGGPPLSRMQKTRWGN